MNSLTILALGDSLTAGFMVAAEQAYPALLERKLIAAGYVCRVVNAGINGDTSIGALSRISRAMTLEPDIVILEIGINDYLSGINPALTAGNIRRMVQIGKENGSMVILAGMRPIQGFGGDDADAFTQLYPTIAEEEAISLISSFLEEVTDNTALTQVDGVHPTAAGYKVVVETVYPHILEAINQLL